MYTPFLFLTLILKSLLFLHTDGTLNFYSNDLFLSSSNTHLLPNSRVYANKSI